MIWIPVAFAYDADTLLQRVEQTRALRSQRIATAKPALSEKEYRTAASGKVATGVEKVEGQSTRIGFGVGVLDVGIEALWAALNDETRHGGLTQLSYVELVSGEQCTDGRKVLMVLPIPLLTDRFWVNVNRFNQGLADATRGKVRELVWSSVAEPTKEPLSATAKEHVDGLVPVGFNRGSWFLVSLDEGHTLGEFTSWVDPGGSVPTGAASMFATAGIEDTFTAMTTYAKRGVLPCRGK